VIANPIPEADEIDAVDWERWLTQARNQTAGAVGRDRTPALLGALHTISGGATLRANLALVRANAALAARLAVAMG
jgi:pseudouridine-5'-phosphate glycosidase